MKFVIRRLAAILGLLGFTSSIGAYLSGNNPFNSAMVIGVAWFILLLTQLRD